MKWWGSTEADASSPPAEALRALPDREAPCAADVSVNGHPDVQRSAAFGWARACGWARVCTSESQSRCESCCSAPRRPALPCAPFTFTPGAAGVNVNGRSAGGAGGAVWRRALWRERERACEWYGASAMRELDGTSRRREGCSAAGIVDSKDELAAEVG